MDITSVAGLSGNYVDAASKLTGTQKTDSGFASMLQSAMGMLDETNQLENDAESAEIQFALGEADNVHDLQIAQKKANLALQYTVAVRDKVLEAYKEIMNMSI